MKRVVIFTNFKKTGARQVLKDLGKWLATRKIKLLAQEQTRKADLIISLGGDGTFLRTARLVNPYEIPVLGVNLGGLGFLAETTADNLGPFLEKIIAGKFMLQERSLLAGEIRRGKKVIASCVALNDFVIKSSVPSRIIGLDLKVNGQYVCNYVGDGLIISTPTGSTAYSLSAKGPVVFPGLPVVLLTPICPHTLTSRPLVLSSLAKIEIRLKEQKKSILSVDGQEQFPFLGNEVLEIEQAKHKLKLIVNPEKNYYQILQEKFQWEKR